MTLRVTSNNFKDLVDSGYHKNETLLVQKGFSNPYVKVADEENRTVNFTISTEDPDRDNDIILADGWQLDAFLANPVVLFGHDSSEPPIAKALNVTSGDGKLKSTAQFMPADMSEFADQIFKMVANGFIRATSVGFMPIEFSISGERDNGGFFPGMDFEKIELMEYSVVPVPANPNALVEARSKGIKTGVLREPLERIIEHRDEWLPSVDKSALEAAYRQSDDKQRKQFNLTQSKQRDLRQRNLEAMGHKQEDEVTNFPEEGDDLKVSLQNSNFEQFDRAFAEDIKENYPEIWDEGGNIRGNEAFELWGRAREGDESEEVLEWIHEREAWAARHKDDFRLPGVVAQMKWGVVGSRGESHMKDVLNEAKEDKQGEVTDTKAGESLDEELKEALAQQKSPITWDESHANGTPVAPMNEEWDGDQAVSDASVDDLHVMATWVDSENSDNKGAYKLPHHRASGQHAVVWRGVVAAMSALLGARGGVDIPDDDREAVYNHLAKHYRDDFDREPPEFKHVESQTLAGDSHTLDPMTGQVKRTKPMGKQCKTINGETYCLVDKHFIKGENLAQMLNDRLDEMAADENERDDLEGEMAQQAGITESTVGQILRGSINCPPLERLEGFAQALQVEVSTIREAAEQDGCEYGDEEAAAGGGEQKDKLDTILERLNAIEAKVTGAESVSEADIASLVSEEFSKALKQRTGRLD